MRGDTTSKGSSSGSHQKKRGSSSGVTSESLGAPSRSLLNIFRIDDLPDFLLVEILGRLPCKFVLRCKCVCKSWSTLISHPYFDSRRALFLRNIGDDDNEQILMFVKYYSYAASHPTSEFFTTSKETPTLLDEFLPMPSSLNIHLAYQNNQVFVLATHNDLILLCDSAWNYQRNYYICNPYTKQWVALPPAPRRRTVMHLGLTTCDSYSRCSTVVRIVEIFEAEPDDLYLKVAIFSFETGEWIETVVACPQGFREVHYRRANIQTLAYKGTLYWLSTDGSLLGLELDYSNHQHCCRFISKPCPDHVDLNQVYMTHFLGVYRGYPRLCRLYPGPSCTLYVWELKEDDEADGCKMMKWCLKERVVLDKLASEFERCRPLAFNPNDEDILYLWRILMYPADSLASIVMCNIRTLTVTDISQNLPCRFRIDAFPFVLPRWRWRWPTPVPRLDYQPQRQNNPN